MRWFLDQLKRRISLVGLMCLAQCCYGLDVSRLWLAKSQQKYYLQLVAAAESAETLERCDQVLEGTLDRGQSDIDRPIFRILCRQPDGLSYNEMVDGVTFETLTTAKPVEVQLSAEELEQQRLEEERRAREALALRKSNMWRMCEAALTEETKMMIDLAWLGEGQPEPQQIDELAAIYKVEFNAQSIWGQPLTYEAICEVNDAEVESTEVKRRVGQSASQ